MPCCQGDTAGEWRFPNNTAVTDQSTFRTNRNDNGEINLFRASSDVVSPTGRFCCHVPDATGTTATLCVNIGELA